MLYIYMYIQFRNDTIDMKVFNISGDASKILLIFTFYFYKDLQLKYKQII